MTIPMKQTTVVFYFMGHLSLYKVDVEGAEFAEKFDQAISNPHPASESLTDWLELHQWLVKRLAAVIGVTGSQLSALEISYREDLRRGIPIIPWEQRHIEGVAVAKGLILDAIGHLSKSGAYPEQKRQLSEVVSYLHGELVNVGAID